MSCCADCEEVEKRWCCRCWITKIPPLWMVISAALCVQASQHSRRIVDYVDIYMCILSVNNKYVL